MRRRLLRLLVAWGAACLAVAALAAAPMPIDVAPDAARVPAWPALRIVAAGARQLTPQQAAELAAGGEATTTDSPQHVLGRGMSPYWASFSLRNPAAAEQLRMLALELTTQFDVRLFARDAAGAWRQVESLADAAAGRIGGGITHPVWALRLPPGRSVDLLLRVEGPAIVRFPLFVYQPASFAEQERKLHVAIGIALASCLLIGFYVATLRRHLDDRSVPWFVGVLVANLLGALWLAGFLGELFPSVPERTLSSIGFAAYAGLFGCGSLHARVYLNTAAWAPRGDRLLLGLGWLWLGLAPWFPLAFPVAGRVLLIWGATAIGMTLIVVSVLAARRKVPFSGYIAAAWIAYLVVGASYSVGRAVSSHLVWPSGALVLVQATVVAVLFGLAMNQRLVRQRDMLVAARQEAVMRHEKAAELTRERGLLYAATNHDLRQPLIGIGLFADLLKSAATPAEREACAANLDMGLKEVDDLLVGMQQLAAIYEGAQRPSFETVALDALLRPLIDEYRGRAEYKRMAIRYVPSRLAIVTHVPYFQRIVRNLLSNAIRYSDEGDRILVGCRRAGGLCLAIADTGRGMTEAQTQRAFDAFARFDPEGAIPDGFGLGLFSTRSLADALGLTVSLRSRHGRGTEFCLSLPAACGAATELTA